MGCVEDHLLGAGPSFGIVGPVSFPGTLGTVGSSGTIGTGGRLAPGGAARGGFTGTVGIGPVDFTSGKTLDRAGGRAAFGGGGPSRRAGATYDRGRASGITTIDVGRYHPCAVAKGMS
jgi:hypothetical protein